jgi:hypothetical protein
MTFVSKKNLYQASWHRLFRVDAKGSRIKTEQEYAQVRFVPNWVGHKKAGPTYRFLAIGQALKNLLPGVEP